MRNEQNPFEKPAKNLEQNSLDSLLTSTTWKRGKKETKSCKQSEEQKLQKGKKKKKGIGKKRNQKLQIERRTKAVKKKRDFNVNGEC